LAEAFRSLAFKAEDANGVSVNAEPEWTERAEKRGLDPLGMQNAGIGLYQSLLPGISNVTLRMRYYGYYCWVSDAYARSGATDEFAAWRTWVRRAEALYALVCSHAKGQGGVGGIDWADRRLALQEDVIDFAEAASSNPNTTRYLRQSLGVFGGAYYSQMVETGLFRQGEHGIQRATNVSGRAAAEAFRTSIGADVENTLSQGIKSAQIARNDLVRLAPIVPSEIPDASSERETYERLLFSSDEATRNDASRSTSLKLILKTAQVLGRRPEADNVRWHLFASDSLGAEALDHQRIRWEAYQCQDLFQVAAAALLEWAIDLMAEFDAGRTLSEIEDEVRLRLRLREAEGDDAAMSWADLLLEIDQRAFDYQSVASRLTSRRGTAEQKAWDAIRLIAALGHRMIERPDLNEIAKRELGAHGGGRSIVSEFAWISSRAQISVGDLIASYMIERVVRRHSWVAMQKLRRQRDYTFLFEVQEGRLVRRNGYAPVTTTPRLSPAIQFLVDVGLLDENGTTARGRTVLEANA
jgi:hypothetical protein